MIDNYYIIYILVEMPDEEPAIQVANVYKSYGRGSKKTHALKNFSMSIPKGKIYGLLGEFSK